MVLVLSRGGYCPKDRRQAEGLVQLHRELEVGYCRLVTISTDNITETNEYRSGVGAHWPFLSDPRRKVQKDLDIAEYTDPLHNPMIPHMIVLEPGLVIYKIYNGYWFFGRPTWKISARTCVPLPRNAGRTGTSQRPNSKRRGNKAARNSSILTAKHTPKLWANRISWMVLEMSASAGRRGTMPIVAWHEVFEKGVPGRKFRHSDHRNGAHACTNHTVPTGRLFRLPVPACRPPLASVHKIRRKKFASPPSHRCAHPKSYRTLRDGLFGVALSRALRARLRSHLPSGTFE